MAQRFVLTAQLNLQAPNLAGVVRSMKSQLQGVNTTVNVTANTQALTKVNSQVQGVTKQTQKATSAMEKFGQSAGFAAKRYAGFVVATSSILLLARAISKATGEAVAFQRELVKIQQVTGQTASQLAGLTTEISRLATGLGVSSKEMLTAARTLAQAGFAADKTKAALEILAQTTLAPTFDDIAKTTEGAVALLSQFRKEATKAGGDIKFLEASLGAINAVSKKFAVESGDLITAIRRTGGAFEAAGGKANELIALFTSVRSTTRESAESIATGFRTIFTRIQRTETIDQMRQLGIVLQDSTGKFVGPMEAVRRLHNALKDLDPRDFRFAAIVEQLGGFRQVSKVIPLIKQYDKATQAYAVAQAGATSVSEDAKTAQQALAVQLEKVKERFLEVARGFVASEGFKTMVDVALKLANAFIKVVEALEPLLPMLMSLAAIKIGMALPGFVKGIKGSGMARGGKVHAFSEGGWVPGTGNRDTIPAMLEPGEFVIKKSSAKKMAGVLPGMNARGYAAGGIVTGSRRRYGAQAGAPAATGGGLTGKPSTAPAALASEAALRAEAMDDVVIQNIINDANSRIPDAFGGAYLFPTGAPGKPLKIQAMPKMIQKSLLTGGFAGMDKAEVGEIINKLGSGAINTTLLKGHLSEAASERVNADLINGVSSGVTNAAKFLNSDLKLAQAGPNLQKALDSNKFNLTNIIGNMFEATLAMASGQWEGGGNLPFDFPTGLGGASYFPGLPPGIPTDAKRTDDPGSDESFTGDVSATPRGTPGKVEQYMAAQIAQSIYKFRTELLQAGIGGQASGKIAKGTLLKSLGFGAKTDLQDPRVVSAATNAGFKWGGTGSSAGWYMPRASGGAIGYAGGGQADDTPALLTPGEFVVKKSSAQSIGYGNLERMNKFAKYHEGGVVGYAAGGKVTGSRHTYGSTGGPGVPGVGMMGAGGGGALETTVQQIKLAGEATRNAFNTISEQGMILHKIMVEAGTGIASGGKIVAQVGQAFLHLAEMAEHTATMFSTVETNLNSSIQVFSRFGTAFEPFATAINNFVGIVQQTGTAISTVDEKVMGAVTTGANLFQKALTDASTGVTSVDDQIRAVLTTAAESFRGGLTDAAAGMSKVDNLIAAELQNASANLKTALTDASAGIGKLDNLLETTLQGAVKPLAQAFSNLATNITESSALFTALDEPIALVVKQLGTLGPQLTKSFDQFVLVDAANVKLITAIEQLEKFIYDRIKSEQLVSGAEKKLAGTTGAENQAIVSRTQSEQVLANENIATAAPLNSLQSSVIIASQGFTGLAMEAPEAKAAFDLTENQLTQLSAVVSAVSKMMQAEATETKTAQDKYQASLVGASSGAAAGGAGMAAGGMMAGGGMANVSGMANMAMMGTMMASMAGQMGLVNEELGEMITQVGMAAGMTAMVAAMLGEYVGKIILSSATKQVEAAESALAAAMDKAEAGGSAVATKADVAEAGASGANTAAQAANTAAIMGDTAAEAANTGATLASASADTLQASGSLSAAGAAMAEAVASSTSAAADTVEAGASGTAAVADTAEAAMSNALTAAKARELAMSRAVSGGVMAFTAVVAVAVGAFVYYTMQAKKAAKVQEEIRKKALKQIREKGDPTGELTAKSVEAARRQGETLSGGQNKAAGAATGAVIGGIAGAVLGSFLGPIGTAIGGFLGAMAGQWIGSIVGSMIPANDKLIAAFVKSAQIQAASARAIFNYNKSVDMVGRQNLQGAKASAAFNKSFLTVESELRGAQQRLKNMELTADITSDDGRKEYEAAQEAVAELAKRAATAEKDVQRGLDGMTQSMLEAGDSFNDILNDPQYQATVKVWIRSLQAAGFSLEEINKIYDGHIERLKGDEKQKKALEAAEKAMLAALQKEIRERKTVLAMNKAIADTTRKLNEFNASADRLVALMSGTVKIQAFDPSTMFEDLKTVDTSQFNSMLQQVVAPFGGAASQMAQDLAQGAVGLQKIPLIAEDLKNAVTLAGPATEAAFVQVLTNAGIKLPQVVQDVFTKQLMVAVKDNKLDLQAVEDAIELTEEFLMDNAEVFERAAKLQGQYLSTIAKTYEQINNLTMKRIQIEQKLIDVQERNADQLAKATGRDRGLDEKNAARRNKERNLLGADANLQGQPAAIGGALRKLRKKIKETQDKLAVEADPKKAKQFMQSLSDMTKRQHRLAKALDNMAKSTQAAADTMAAIQKEQAKRGKVADFIEDWAFATTEDRQEMSKSVMALQRVMSTGDLGSIPDDMKAGVKGLLDQFDDVEMFGGMTGGQVKKQLMVTELDKTIRAMTGGKQGITPDQIKQIFQSTTKEDKLIEDLKAIHAKQEAANQELINNMDQGIGTMTAELVKIHNTFYTNLNNLFNQYFQAGGASAPAAGANVAPATPATGGLITASGGVVYRAGGGSIFKPKGTDTVPAMLTPGEFVIKKSSVDKIGVGNLKALNSGQTGSVGFAEGGQVQYYGKGGHVRVQDTATGTKLKRAAIMAPPGQSNRSGYAAQATGGEGWASGASNAWLDAVGGSGHADVMDRVFRGSSQEKMNALYEKYLGGTVFGKMVGSLVPAEFFKKAGLEGPPGSAEEYKKFMNNLAASIVPPVVHTLDQANFFHGYATTGEEAAQFLAIANTVKDFPKLVADRASQAKHAGTLTGLLGAAKAGMEAVEKAGGYDSGVNFSSAFESMQEDHWHEFKELLQQYKKKHIQRHGTGGRTPTEAIEWRTAAGGLSSENFGRDVHVGDDQNLSFGDGDDETTSLEDFSVASAAYYKTYPYYKSGAWSSGTVDLFNKTFGGSVPNPSSMAKGPGLFLPLLGAMKEHKNVFDDPELGKINVLRHSSWGGLAQGLEALKSFYKSNKTLAAKEKELKGLEGKLDAAKHDPKQMDARAGAAAEVRDIEEAMGAGKIESLSYEDINNKLAANVLAWAKGRPLTKQGMGIAFDLHSAASKNEALSALPGVDTALKNFHSLLKADSEAGPDAVKYFTAASEQGVRFSANLDPMQRDQVKEMFPFSPFQSPEELALTKAFMPDFLVHYSQLAMAAKAVGTMIENRDLQGMKTRKGAAKAFEAHQKHVGGVGKMEALIQDLEGKLAKAPNEKVRKSIQDRIDNLKRGIKEKNERWQKIQDHRAGNVGDAKARDKAPLIKKIDEMIAENEEKFFGSAINNRDVKHPTNPDTIKLWGRLIRGMQLQSQKGSAYRLTGTGGVEVDDVFTPQGTKFFHESGKDEHKGADISEAEINRHLQLLFELGDHASAAGMKDKSRGALFQADALTSMYRAHKKSMLKQAQDAIDKERDQAEKRHEKVSKKGAKHKGASSYDAGNVNEDQWGNIGVAGGFSDAALATEEARLIAKAQQDALEHEANKTPIQRAKEKYESDMASLKSNYGGRIATLDQKIASLRSPKGMNALRPPAELKAELDQALADKEALYKQRHDALANRTQTYKEEQHALRSNQQTQAKAAAEQKTQESQEKQARRKALREAAATAEGRFDAAATMPERIYHAAHVRDIYEQDQKMFLGEKGIGRGDIKSISWQDIIGYIEDNKNQFSEEALNKLRPLAEIATGAVGFASGGRVPQYASLGKKISGMGTDTVPAMLTPGEFVMNRSAVQKHGISFMNALNAGNVQGFFTGGPVGRAREGGGSSGGGFSINLSAIGQAISEAVSSSVTTIEDPLNGFASSINAAFGESVRGFQDSFGNILGGLTQALSGIAIPGLDSLVAATSTLMSSLENMTGVLSGITFDVNVHHSGEINITGMGSQAQIVANAIKSELGDYVGELVKMEMNKPKKKTQR